MNDTASDLSADLAQALSTFMDEAAELLAEMEAILDTYKAALGLG